MGLSTTLRKTGGLPCSPPVNGTSRPEVRSCRCAIDKAGLVVQRPLPGSPLSPFAAVVARYALPNVRPSRKLASRRRSSFMNLEDVSSGVRVRPRRLSNCDLKSGGQNQITPARSAACRAFRSPPAACIHVHRIWVLRMPAVESVENTQGSFYPGELPRRNDR